MSCSGDIEVSTNVALRNLELTCIAYPIVVLLQCSRHGIESIEYFRHLGNANLILRIDGRI